jgi:hypothetical protein
MAMSFASMQATLVGPHWEPSALSFALSYGLDLHVHDALTRNSSIRTDPAQSVFSPLLGALAAGVMTEQRVLELARLVLAHGYYPNRDDVAFLFGNHRMSSLLRLPTKNPLSLRYTTNLSLGNQNRYLRD